MIIVISFVIIIILCFILIKSLAIKYKKKSTKFIVVGLTGLLLILFTIGLFVKFYNSTDDYRLQKMKENSRVINFVNSEGKPVECEIILPDSPVSYAVYGYIGYNKVENKTFIVKAKGYLTDTIITNSVSDDVVV